MIVCFRRDKEYCHECRYCCTLSICTTSEGFAWGNYYEHSNKTLREALHKGQLDGIPEAVIGFSIDKLMYKKNDFRCLKPKDGVPIEKWPHYEMHGYRAAKTEEELSKVQEIPFDKNFFNFEDPEVLNSFTDGSDNSVNLWKKTYGFDWGVWRRGSVVGLLSIHCIVLFNPTRDGRGCFTPPPLRFFALNTILEGSRGSPNC